jgi:hypothetical protein
VPTRIAVNINFTDLTGWLPYYRGTTGNQTYWYIVSDTSDAVSESEGERQPPNAACRLLQNASAAFNSASEPPIVQLRALVPRSTTTKYCQAAVF